MKKVIVLTFAVIIAVLTWEYLYYFVGVLYVPYKEEISCNFKVDDDRLCVDAGTGFEEFVMKGVNIGFGKPGAYATENAITKEEYLRWFEEIQNMGANVIQVLDIANEEFYDAFYEYNIHNKTPLYLLQGMTVDEFLMDSIYGAYDDEFYKPFLRNCKKSIDVVHGRYKKYSKYKLFPIHYSKDVSQWVVGYAWGTEWKTNLVVYTDKSYEKHKQYDGTYLYTENASNFEIFLAEIGDQLITYESEKYGTQSLISFTNWTFTDPLRYEENVEKYFRKAAQIDVEHIMSKGAFLSGQFASYHANSAYPDFYSLVEGHEENTYRQYVRALSQHHTMPVVITEFGISSSRALVSKEETYGRNQGHMSETEQGEALVSLFEDIMAAGCDGGIVSAWQDEWYKNTWNTMAAINLDSTAYWSDYQSCEQSYGLLSFDPGKKNSICYVDGEIDDWTEQDLVSAQNNTHLYMKYDEKFIYFMVKKDGFDVEKTKLYIPIDITPKSGALSAENLNITMTKPADFVIEIDGKENSRIWVQERYDMLSALFYEDISAHNFFSKEFPMKDSSKFVGIKMLMQNELYYELKELGSEGTPEDRQLSFAEYDIENPYHYKVKGHYETGCLTYGNSNPKASNFDSLADYCAKGECVEIKIPWQLLNVADPTRMYIHDDYYTHYGIEYLKIDSIAVGAGGENDNIVMENWGIKPLGKKPEYHERLKKSYYILQKCWKN